MSRFASFCAGLLMVSSLSGCCLLGHGCGGGGQNNFGMLTMYSGSRKRGVYREWRREVTAYVLVFQVPKEQAGPRVWLRLAGEARDAVEHLDMQTDLAVDGGLDKLLAAHPPSGMLSVKRWKPAGEHLICVKALKKVEADVGAYKIRIPNGEVKWIPVSTFDSLVESGNVTEFRSQDKVY